MARSIGRRLGSRAPVPPTTDIFSWNPWRPTVGGRLGRLWPARKQVNNFGDLLGPLIVERMIARAGRDSSRPVGSWQLMTVGSVMNFARDGAVVWGSGINGKLSESYLTFRELDVRAVRGPRTQRVLLDRGIAVPSVFGDPALLVPRLFPELQAADDRASRRQVIVVPNLNDTVSVADLPDAAVIVDPREPVFDVIRAIVNSELVVASSLHGLVIAEAFGVPARMVQPGQEHLFKYQDYYEATGRPDFRVARTIAEALDLGGEAPLDWDAQPLLDAFPAELWATRDPV